MAFLLETIWVLVLIIIYMKRNIQDIASIDLDFIPSKRNRIDDIANVSLALPNDCVEIILQSNNQLPQIQNIAPNNIPHKLIDIPCKPNELSALHIQSLHTQ